MNAVRISSVGPFVRNDMLASMGSLFAELARQASTNARREVETYTREIPEFGFLGKDVRARAETLEHAVWLRHRTVELSPDNSELTGDDLDYIASMGELRAAAGMSLDARQGVLRVHTALMLREINEATDAQRGGGVDELMRMMTWFAPQGERGIGAYRQGFVRVLRRRMPYTEQVALLARSMLKGDPISAEIAAAVDMELPEHCAVTVFRLPDPPVVDRFLENEIETLVKAHQTPVMWGPEDGEGGAELIALVPLTPAATTASAATPAAATASAAMPAAATASATTVSATTASVATPAAAAQSATMGRSVPPHIVPDLLPDLAPEHLPDLVRDFARALGRPCAVGTATAPLPELAEALDRARRIGRAAPLRRASGRLRPHALADVFVELAVADVPFVDTWLRSLARTLESGPDLLLTLDAYYRHDMHRGPTATALNVHTRTLDYRLRRVRELTGLDPGSTRGVRTLTAVVTRHLSGAWD